MVDVAEVGTEEHPAAFVSAHHPQPPWEPARSRPSCASWSSRTQREARAQAWPRRRSRWRRPRRQECPRCRWGRTGRVSGRRRATCGVGGGEVILDADLIGGDEVVVVRGGQLNRWRRRRGSDGGGGRLDEGLSEPDKLRLQVLANCLNLGQEQLVVERTHGVVVVDFVDDRIFAPSTNLLARPSRIEHRTT